MADRQAGGRGGRILVGIVLPCPVAALVVTLLLAVVEESGWGLVLMFPAFVTLAYYVGGLQFVLYSLLMEFGVWRVVGVSCVSLLVSALLGMACGLSVFLIIRGPFLPTCLYAGFVAGLVTGLALYGLKKRASKPAVSDAPN